MVFDVFPTVLPVITSPVKLDIDLAFITPCCFDLASVAEVSSLNILAKDVATIIEVWHGKV